MRARKIIAGCLILLAVTGIVLSGCGRAKEEVKEGIKQEIKEESEEEIKEEKAETWERWETSLEEQKHTQVTAEALRGLRLETEAGREFAVAYDPRVGKDSFDYWNISEPYRSFAVVNTEKLYQLFDAVEVLAGQMVPTELGEVQQVKTQAGQGKITMAFLRDQKPGEKGEAEPDSSMTWTVKGKNEKDDYVLVTEGDENVYTAPTALVEAVLNINSFDYILKVPLLINKDTVKEVEVVYEDETYPMKYDEGGYYFGEKKVEEESYQQLYTQLLSVLIKEELLGNRGGAPGSPILTVRFIRNDREMQDYEVVYWTYDEDSAAVQINGQTFFLTDTADVLALASAVEEYFAR